MLVVNIGYPSFINHTVVIITPSGAADIVVIGTPSGAAHTDG
jgi:hypothetical protein